METEETWLWLFEWFEYTTPGIIVRESVWMFPVIEAVHLLGLCLLGGAVITVDLRMLGLGLRKQTISELATNLRPWLIGAVVLMLATGTLLFLSEAVKCYYNTSFWVKMITLPIALGFTFLVRDPRIMKGAPTLLQSRMLGSVSMALWFVVAAAGRWIGYS